MPPPRTHRIAARAATVLAIAAVLVVATAPPAAAHNASSGSLPAPPWLLSYIGVFLVLATALAVRATWPRARLHRFTTSAPLPASLHAGHLIGAVLYVLVVAAALIGPDDGAANVAPVAVLVWWLALPILCLAAGDVMAVVNPFVAVVRLLERGRPERDGSAAPAWLPAAFLGAFAWFSIAYHRPGSPRSVAVFLLVYAIASVLAGLRWGSRWLSTGEGFGALSASVARLCPWLPSRAPVPGMAAVMVVWIGATAYDGFASTPFWLDVAGSSVGWERTIRSTLGLVWVIALVGGAYLTTLRVADRGEIEDAGGEGTTGRAATGLATGAARFGVALVPLAVGWFLAHDLTLLILEGQNLIVLLSDPIERGWDLLGPVDDNVDYGLTQAWWVAWTQVLALGAGHVGSVVVAHDTALHHLRRRPAMVVTWCFTALAAVSIVAAALLVLG